MRTLETLFKNNNLQFQSFSTTVRCQNACCRNIMFRKISAVPNLLKYRHNACFREIVFIFSAIPICLKYRHDAQFTTLGFTFSAVLTRFKSRHNACLSYIPFIFFSAVPNCFKYRPSACYCFHFFSLQFHIVSNTVSCHIFENAIALILFILRT